MAVLREARWGACGWPLAGWLALSSCAVPPPEPREPSVGHIRTTVPGPEAPDIPEPVKTTPFLPEPQPAAPVETYTVVVNEVPVKELLFALARDAAINVDVHPNIAGTVTMNAVDQTLDQILDRIARQIDLRYEMRNEVLVVEPDAPFLKSYAIDYVNMTRDSTSDTRTSTQVATAAGAVQVTGAGNASDTVITNESNHRLWETLVRSVGAIIGGELAEEAVIASPESGVLTVRATAREHEEVQKYLDLVMSKVRRQVLIEATIVEVMLEDRYQAGIDWERLATGAGFTLAQGLLGGFAPAAGGATTGLLLNYGNDDPEERTVDLTLRLLQEFGDTRVLSSPKLMALNNQTAILKVVDNEVFFTLELEEEEREDGDEEITLTTQVNTVAVGLIMNITPQIDDADTVTLNVRPTITRVREFVPDPGVALIAARLGAQGGVDTSLIQSQVPVVQERVTETVLKVDTGQIAVLGGLMQDTTARDVDAVPTVSDVPVAGEAFKFHDRAFQKSELVVFLRPWVVRTPSIEADLRSFQPLLPEHLEPAEPVRSESVEYLP